MQEIDFFYRERGMNRIKKCRRLFFEEIFKRRPGIERFCGRSLAFDGGSGSKEGTLVPRVLFGNPRGDGPGAFEPARSVKERALLATVEFDAALRTLPLRVGACRQNRRARRAAPHSPLPWHVGRPWAERFLPFFGAPLALLAVGVHVALLVILSAHDRTSLFLLFPTLVERPPLRRLAFASHGNFSGWNAWKSAGKSPHLAPALSRPKPQVLCSASD